MNLSEGQHFARAWLLLVVLTLISFFVAEQLSMRLLAIAAIMVFSGFKVRLVLYRFMELGKLPLPFRIFFNVWITVCSSMIFGLYWYAQI